MTSYSEILVLVANDESATLCANADGETRLLRSIERSLPAGGEDSENVFRNRHNFACQLMMALCRSAGEHMYDGVVLFADGPMMDELRLVQTMKISQLMIAHVVGRPSNANHSPGYSAANSQAVNRGAVH